MMKMINVVSLNSVADLETIAEPHQQLSNHPSIEYWEALSTRSALSAYQISSLLERIESSRTKLCEWAYLLVDHYNIERSIVSIAFSMFDRYVSRFQETDLELLTLSCVYTAVKVHSCKGKLPPSMLAKLAQSSCGEARFSVQQIEQMEYAVCSSLEWRVNPPTLSMFLDAAFDYIESNSSKCHLNLIDAMKELSLFLVEMSVIDVYFAHCSPASIAAGAILVAMEELSAPSSIRASLSSLQQDDLETGFCTYRLGRHYQNWKREENSRSDRRKQSASPTGIIETSHVEVQEGEGNRLEKEFEDEREVIQGKEHGAKRKRDISL